VLWCERGITIVNEWVRVVVERLGVEGKRADFEQTGHGREKQSPNSAVNLVFFMAFHFFILLARTEDLILP